MSAGARTSRRGIGLLAITLALSAGCALIAIAYNTLWRGSSRTLFSIQEDRELVNLARSSLAEAAFQLQLDLDQSTQKWFDWCTATRPVPVQTARPAVTQQNAGSMSPDPRFLRYTAGDVTIARIRNVSAQSAGNEMGIIDLKVTVEVARENVKHHAKLTMVERRSFWLADDLGPYGSGGRRVELGATPVGTVLAE